MGLGSIYGAISSDLDWLIKPTFQEYSMTERQLTQNGNACNIKPI